VAADQASPIELAAGNLRELLRIIGRSDIEELELEVAETRLYLKRPTSEVPPDTAAPEPRPTQPPAVLEADVVLAERVGFFHHPGDDTSGPPEVGQRVAAGQVLGSIDSLNVLIPVHAARAGRLAEVLVEEGQPVEFGQRLFVVRASED
jgi:biotin carboxyl carrier protein